KCFALHFSADKLCSGGNVSPLVRTAHLKFHILLFIKMKEIIALQQLIGEFSKTHTLSTVFTCNPLLHGFFGHHIIYGEVLADVPYKIQETEFLHPVVIVHQFGSVGFFAFKIQEFRKLCLDTAHIMVQCFLVQQVSFTGFAGRITNHTGSTTDKSDGLMAVLLEMGQNLYRNKTSYMQ